MHDGPAEAGGAADGEQHRQGGEWPTRDSALPRAPLRPDPSPPPHAQPLLAPQELALLDASNAVYKLVGPVLVKQDTEEAKATVGKRLDYIGGEM